MITDLIFKTTSTFSPHCVFSEILKSSCDLGAMLLVILDDSWDAGIIFYGLRRPLFRLVLHLSYDRLSKAIYIGEDTGLFVTK